MKTQFPKNILRIDSSARSEGSISRSLTDNLIAKLNLNDDVHIITRDLTTGVPFVDSDWIAANFTAPDIRTPEQQNKLSYSDQLVDEIEVADALVIGLPIYNFNMPASVKAWIDMTARVHRTFRYTADGPIGLMQNKRAYIVVASGGTKLGSDIDFATPYICHALKFIGITDVTFIDGSTGKPDAVERANNQIQRITT